MLFIRFFLKNYGKNLGGHGQIGLLKSAGETVHYN